MDNSLTKYEHYIDMNGNEYWYEGDILASEYYMPSIIQENYKAFYWLGQLLQERVTIRRETHKDIFDKLDRLYNEKLSSIKVNDIVIVIKTYHYKYNKDNKRIFSHKTYAYETDNNIIVNDLSFKDKYLKSQVTQDGYTVVYNKHPKLDSTEKILVYETDLNNKVTNKYYYVNGVLDRGNYGPAVIFGNSTVVYYTAGLKTKTIYFDGNVVDHVTPKLEKPTFAYKVVKEVLHNEFGPASSFMGNRYYFINGLYCGNHKDFKNNDEWINYIKKK